jgi:hypothetical protein
MKVIKEVPDKIIKLEHGDRVEITIRKRDILFICHVDGDGCAFALTKEDLKEMLK